MEGIIAFAAVLYCAVLFIKFLNKKEKQKRQVHDDVWVPQTKIPRSADNEMGVDTRMYRKRYRLMNNSESSFFYAALKQLPEGYFIFPKMRIADIIETVDGHGYYHHRNKILPKHVDFVVCDKSLRPVYAVEIDGSSHNNSERQERDRLVNHIFEKVGVPLKRVKVGSSFDKECLEMNQALNIKRES